MAKTLNLFILLCISAALLSPRSASATCVDEILQNQQSSEAQPLSQSAQLDLGTHKISPSLETEPIGFEVTNKTMSLLFSAVSPNKATYSVAHLIDPDGNVINMEKYIRRYDDDLAAMLYPNDGTIRYLKPGHWQVVFQAKEFVPDDELKVTLVSKTTESLEHRVARFKLNLFFTGSSGVTAENFKDTPFGDEIEKAIEILADIGLQADISVGGNLDNSFQRITTFVDDSGWGSNAQDLLNSAPITEGSARLFLVSELLYDFGEAHGISFGAPSCWDTNCVIVTNGTAFSPNTRMFRRRNLVLHELGHMFGLFHTFEANGLVNHLEDTIGDLNNIMIPQVLQRYDNFEFTPSQIAVIKNHPLVELLP